MMPDLCKYAVTVLGAYGATIVLLAGLIAISVWRARAVRAMLRAQERRTQGQEDGQ